MDVVGYVTWHDQGIEPFFFFSPSLEIWKLAPILARESVIYIRLGSNSPLPRFKLQGKHVAHGEERIVPTPSTTK